MIIEELELFLYKRLMLSNINHFIYKPKELYQLILGMNGSGKSSILSELSPLPASKSDFNKEGYKIIKFIFNDIYYVLTSSFLNGSKYSFKKYKKGSREDFEELNQGGTGQVQKELVLKEFNYDQKLHLVLTGERRFTDMSISERREWFTRLSPCNMDYSIKIYNAIKSAYNDSNSVLKHLEKRIIVETDKYNVLKELKDLEEKVNSLKRILTQLLLERDPNVDLFSVVENRFNLLIEQLEVLTKKYFNTFLIKPDNFNYSSFEEFQNIINDTNSLYKANQSLLVRYSNEIADIEQFINNFSSDKNLTQDKIELLLLELENKIEHCDIELIQFKDINVDNDTLENSKYIIPTIIQLFLSLQDNKDRTFNKENYENLKKETNEKQRTVDIAYNRININTRRIDEINSSKENNCPKCGYVWKPGYSEYDIKTLENTNAKLIKEIESFESIIKNNNQYFENYENLINSYGQIKKIFRDYPKLSSLWNYLIENNFIFDNPSSRIQIFYNWLKDVETINKLNELKKKHSQLLEFLEKQKINEGFIIETKVNEIKKNIESITFQIHNDKEKLNILKNHQNFINLQKNALNDIDLIYQKLRKVFDQLLSSNKNKELDLIIDKHQIEFNILSKQLNEKIVLENLIEDLKKQYTKVKNENNDLSILMSELSPTEGLIAEQLTKFIQFVIGQMNNIINSIWTYPLEIQPCSLDEGELDYKFPIVFQNNDFNPPDVSNGSKAQKEIINLSFILTTYILSGHSNFPLLLDEPGSGFDEQHRINLLNLIKQIIETNEHPQMFMISHYIDQYGVFEPNEVLVLDSNNIATPEVYNTHVYLG